MPDHTRESESDRLKSRDLFAPSPSVSGALPPAPEAIGPYRILSQLGEGGFGVVYLAEQRTPVRRRVALKLIKPGMDSKAVVARFEAERQALALMDHANVARVFDAGATERGLPYFVMEYVRGVPITEHCDAQRLSVNDRVRLFATVCDAIQHAHTKGVIHRDLKPSNILIEHTDAKAVPKIIDFGVAKALYQPLTDATLYTQQGQLLGTPEYMSPEQASLDSRGVDTRTDIYALGVILYELLTGARPFDMRSLRHASMGEVHRMIREVDPPRPSTRISQRARTHGASEASPVAHANHSAPPGTPGEAAPGAGSRGTRSPARTTAHEIAAARRTTLAHLRKRLAKDLDWITMRCLEKDRERRYDSASALADDLQRFLADEPVAAGPPSALYRARKFARRNHAAVTAGVAIALAIVLGLAAATYGLVQATHQRDAARAAQRTAESARAEAEAVINFLTTMLASVEPGAETADVTVRKILDDAAVRIDDGSLDDQPIVEARLRYTIGRAYLELGLYPEAEPHLEHSLTLLRENLTEDDHLTLRTINDLARLRQAQGNLDEAADMLTHAIERSRAAAGPDDELTLTMLSNLAAVRYSQGRLPDAARAFHDTLELLEKTLGPEHRRTLICRANLAVVYQVLGRLDDAGREYRTILDVRRRMLGPDHADTIQAEELLGSLLIATKRYDDADPLLHDALDRRRKNLGPDHPATLKSQATLAHSLTAQARYDEAIPLLRDLVERQSVIHPDTHRDTLTARSNLANAIRLSGNPTGALPILQACVQDARAAYAPDHYLLGYQLHNLGRCLADLDRREEAERILLEAYEIISTSLGPDHRVATDVAESLARFYAKTGDLDAEVLWQKRATPAQPEAAN